MQPKQPPFPTVLRDLSLFTLTPQLVIDKYEHENVLSAREPAWSLPCSYSGGSIIVWLMLSFIHGVPLCLLQSCISQGLPHQMAGFNDCTVQSLQIFPPCLVSESLHPLLPPISSSKQRWNSPYLHLSAHKSSSSFVALTRNNRIPRAATTTSPLPCCLLSTNTTFYVTSCSTHPFPPTPPLSMSLFPCHTEIHVYHLQSGSLHSVLVMWPSLHWDWAIILQRNCTLCTAFTLTFQIHFIFPLSDPSVPPHCHNVAWCKLEKQRLIFPLASYSRMAWTLKSPVSAIPLLLCFFPLPPV